MYLDGLFSKMCERGWKKEYVEELCLYINIVWKEAKTNQLLILIFELLESAFCVDFDV